MSPCAILLRYTQADFDVPMILACAGIVVGIAALQRNKVRPQMQHIIYAFIAGFVGAILNILLKVVGEFTQGALAGDPESISMWSTIMPYLHIVGLCVCFWL